MYYCYNCNEPVDLSIKIGRRDTCEMCNTDLHVCLNCKFYDEGAPNQCKEPTSAFVKYRDQSNFCQLFEFNPGKHECYDEVAKSAKNKLDTLFKNSGPAKKKKKILFPED